MNRPTPLMAAAAALALSAVAGRAAAAACEDLAKLDLPDTQITTAEPIAAGAFDAPGVRTPLDVPAMCRVAGIVSPAVKFEVWLPEGSAWNGRFQAVGGGGLAGVISYAAMAGAVRAGYASASTDTGHEARDTTWLSDTQRVVDYGYRAIHEMTVKAKDILAAYYEKDPSYAYFNGCSTGGRQGLMEAQRYPDDYDGIVSGAPVNYFTHLHIGQLWTAHATLGMPGAVLSADDFSLVGRKVMEACDANDGVEDGILTDPRTCDFDPGVLQCTSGQPAGTCLTTPQVKALKMIYQGPVNPRTGAPIYPGLEPGGEAATRNNRGWAMLMNGKGPFFYDTAVIGGMTFENPDWDWRRFDFDEDVRLVDGKLYGVLNAINPDLRDFEAHDGKLIIYHGWADPGVMPQQTIDYYDSVVDFAAQAGGTATEEHVRLFMMPGMGHCSGGTGPDEADFMAAISAWVEHDQAPERIVARKVVDGRVTMTRPLCPHPQVARYKGSGDTSDARNFECAMPE
jgi:feruloyl esterase